MTSGTVIAPLERVAPAAPPTSSERQLEPARAWPTPKHDGVAATRVPAATHRQRSGPRALRAMTPDRR